MTDIQIRKEQRSRSSQSNYKFAGYPQCIAKENYIHQIVRAPINKMAEMTLRFATSIVPSLTEMNPFLPSPCAKDPSVRIFHNKE